MDFLPLDEANSFFFISDFLLDPLLDCELEAVNSGTGDKKGNGSNFGESIVLEKGSGASFGESIGLL